MIVPAIISNFPSTKESFVGTLLIDLAETCVPSMQRELRLWYATSSLLEGSEGCPMQLFEHKLGLQKRSDNNGSGSLIRVLVGFMSRAQEPCVAEVVNPSIGLAVCVMCAI